MTIGTSTRKGLCVAGCHWVRLIVALLFYCTPTLSGIEPVHADTFRVTQTSGAYANKCDLSSCTLHDAIVEANRRSGPDIIEFDFSKTQPGLSTITLVDPLPDITDSLTIDGTSQFPDSPVPYIEILGNASKPGLTIKASNCTVKGLIINSVKDYAILISNSSNTTITGNWLGLSSEGLPTLVNTHYGIKIESSPNSVIGGSTNKLRNVISGNGLSGIFISGSDGSIISGNWIGLSPGGLAAAANASYGIDLLSSSQVTIGGTTSGSRNVIGGNLLSGIRLTSAISTKIAGNIIGMDSTGLAGLPNGQYGIEVKDSLDTIIGDTNTDYKNIISRSGLSGIKLTGSTDSTILGNWIGLDASGMSAAGNSAYGIELSNSSNNIIGDSSTSSRNVISGNGSYGIALSDDGCTGNTIKGNYIGLNQAGDGEIPNTGGILVSGPQNTIGGTSAGERNVIAGIGSSSLFHILISGTEGTQVYGNYIGTNADGTVGFSKDKSGSISGVGIGIYNSKNNSIGKPGAGNLISGNAIGIELNANSSTPFQTTGNHIQSNQIGTSTSGSSALPNLVGISMVATAPNVLSNNTIGGANATDSVEGNIISGNGMGEETGAGIQLIGQSVHHNSIQGNYIGTAGDGVTDLGNTGPGISLNCSDTEIVENTIAYNGKAGIAQRGGTGNHISRNKIFNNIELGIDQMANPADSGPNPADPTDSDSGPNNFQNFPQFGVTAPIPGKIQVIGTLNSTPSETFTLEFFLNDSIDDSGYGEGERFLGSTEISTNPQGKASFNVDFSTTISDSGGISATASDSKGNSSEFSLGMTLTKEAKPGGKVDQAPVVAIVDDVVTVSLPLYKPPRKKREKPSKRSRSEREAKRSVNYQVTIKRDGRAVIQRITTKRNVVTIRNLPPGNYAVNYRVSLREGDTVVGTTRPSPSTTFTVKQNAAVSGLNTLPKMKGHS